MIDSGFSEESLEAVSKMLASEEFACGDTSGPKKPRTAAQKAADASRSAKMKGKNHLSPAVRSAAAKKAAATRRECNS